MKLLFLLLLIIPSKLYCQFSETINGSNGWLYTISYVSERDKGIGIKNNKSINKLLCQAITNKEYSIFFSNLSKLKGNSIKFNFKNFDSTLVTISINDFSKKYNAILDSKCIHLYNPLLSDGATEFYKRRERMLLKEFLDLFLLNVKQQQH